MNIYQKRNIKKLTASDAFYPSTILVWKLFLQLISILLILVISLSHVNAQKNNLEKQVDKIIKHESNIDLGAHPGFIIAIIDNDSTFVLNYGQAEITSKEIFEIGGLTKVFTANLALQLSNLGLLDLDKKINEYLPQEYRNTKLSQYALSDLLIHKIPFPKRPTNISLQNKTQPYINYSKGQLLNYYKNFLPIPNKKWKRKSLYYSHINYGLLEIIIEQHLTEKFESLMDFYLLDKLGLNSSGITVNSDSITSGYNLNRTKSKPLSFNSFAASEGLKSNMEDLTRYLKLNLQLYSSELDSTMQYCFEFQEDALSVNNISHSYGWYLIHLNESTKIVTHSGGTEMHRASMHFIPKTKTGVIILSKSNQGTGELGMLILRMINYNWKRIK